MEPLSISRTFRNIRGTFVALRQLVGTFLGIFKNFPGPPHGFFILGTGASDPWVHQNLHVLNGISLIALTDIVYIFSYPLFNTLLFIQRWYFYSFKELRNRFQGMDSASLCSLAGRYHNPIPTLFLVPIDCYKIPTQMPMHMDRIAYLVFLITRLESVDFMFFNKA